MKYKPLEEPCRSYYLKCGRVEQVDFVKDENCKYANRKKCKRQKKKLVCM